MWLVNVTSDPKFDSVPVEEKKKNCYKGCY